MNRTGNNVVLLAVVLSLIAHAALMVCMRTKVMTHVIRTPSARTHRDPMHMEKAIARERPTSLDEILDLKPLREAPRAKAAELPAVSNVSDQEADSVAVPVPTAEAPVALPEPDVVPKLEVVAMKTATAEAFVPVPSQIETPKAGLLVKTPVAPPPTLPTVAASLDDRELTWGRESLRPEPVQKVSAQDRSEPSQAFVPAAEVFAEVDQKVVEAEKAAVRALVNSESARELSPFVTLAMSRFTAADGEYFLLTLAARPELKPVSKDVVVLLDASGSIGSDRMGSIRKAAKRILRSATNTGDRFNLVAFRDRYSYAFRAWQNCTQSAFDAADKWLNNLAAHGRTDVFSTIESVLTLPRDPARPLIALVVTDGDANSGISGTAEIVSKFTELNDGLVSVYMYGVKSAANRELMDGLTRGNRGESFIFEGFRWSAGEGLEGLSERFRDPVLSDLRLVFASDSGVECYPRRLRNLYRGNSVTVVGRLPRGRTEIAFSIKGLNGSRAYESYFKVPLAQATLDSSLSGKWREERKLDFKTGKGR